MGALAEQGLDAPRALGPTTGAVEPVVDLGPGAEKNPLARVLAELVRTNVRRAAQRRELERLRGSIAVVADDAGSALTLRFDFGRLTVHEGIVGIPDVTLRGRSTDIEALADLPFKTRLRLPLPAPGDADGRRAVSVLWSALRGRRIKIYGLLSHPRLIYGLLRVLARSG